MTTARQIITRALQKNGALIKGEVPDADEADDALSALNAMISSWGNDSLIVYARTWETFPLTSASSYTIGVGGDFNTVRPLDIVSAYIRNSGVDYPMTVVTDEAYNTITFKSLNGIPEFLNYDNAYPLGKIRLYPVGSASYSLFLLTEKAITQFTSLDTEMILPDGWERALIYNLALELAPEYSQKPDPYTVKIAADSLGAIKAKVAQVRTMDAYPQNMAVRNIFSGWYY